MSALQHFNGMIVYTVIIGASCYIYDIQLLRVNIPVCSGVVSNGRCRYQRLEPATFWPLDGVPGPFVTFSLPELETVSVTAAVFNQESSAPPNAILLEFKLYLTVLKSIEDLECRFLSVSCSTHNLASMTPVQAHAAYYYVHL